MSSSFPSFQARQGQNLATLPPFVPALSVIEESAEGFNVESLIKPTSVWKLYHEACTIE